MPINTTGDPVTVCLNKCTAALGTAIVFGLLGLWITSHTHRKVENIVKTFRLSVKVVDRYCGHQHGFSSTLRNWWCVCLV